MQFNVNRVKVCHVSHSQSLGSADAKDSVYIKYFEPIFDRGLNVGCS
jgi:hypothetical protein